MQPLVIVESVMEDKATKAQPDRKLYRALHPGFDQVTLIPGGGKSECKSLLRALNELLPQFSGALNAVALLDRDADIGPGDRLVQLLPVAMIENLLLDPDSMWESLQSVIEKGGFKTVADIRLALDQTLEAQEESEIIRRTALALGSSHFYPPSSGDVAAAAKAFVEAVTVRYDTSAVASAAFNAATQVAALRDSNRRREEFHGKAVLQMFYKEHLHASGIPKGVFAFETARHARKRKSVRDFFDGFFASLASAKQA